KRSRGSDWAESGVVPRPKTVRGCSGLGCVSTGATRVPRDEAPHRYAEAYGGVAGKICEKWRSEVSGQGPVKKKPESMTADGQTVEKLRKAYRVLDVPEAASALAIKSNYRKLIKRWHPDRPATNAASSAEAMMMTKLINEAYSLIENAPLRYYAGGKGSQTAQTKSAEPKIHSVNDVDLSDMFFNEKRIEYAVRIVCGAISGVFVGF